MTLNPLRLLQLPCKYRAMTASETSHMDSDVMCLKVGPFLGLSLTGLTLISACLTKSPVVCVVFLVELHS